MNKLRWGKFYWSDWADDPALALCSLAAQGLWMRLLCIAAQGTPYGHVTINGKPATVQQIDALINVDRRGHGTRYVPRLIDELVQNGVAVTGDCGCLISRRMERDGRVFQARHKAAEKRWKHDVNNEETTKKDAKKNSGNPAENSHSYHDLHMQKKGFASTEAEAEAEADPPTPNPKPRRKKQDGAWTGHAKREAN